MTENYKDIKMMNKKRAYSWLTQPGIKATLFHYDRDTNSALKTAIHNLNNKKADRKELIKKFMRPTDKDTELYKDTVAFNVRSIEDIINSYFDELEGV